jgi:chloramphenicol-sensitive protein RarD
MAGFAVVLQAVLAGGIALVSLVLAFLLRRLRLCTEGDTGQGNTRPLFVETVLLFPIAIGYLLLQPEPWGVDALILE